MGRETDKERKKERKRERERERERKRKCVGMVIDPKFMAAAAIEDTHK